MSLLLRPRCRLHGGQITELLNPSTRQFSSSRRWQSSADPKSIAEAFLAKFAQGQTFIRKQLIDANQLRLLSLTLNRSHLWPKSALLSESLEEVEPVEGTPVPPGYHLVYFTPPQLPGRLGLDGTDTSFNPNAPFTRRMWAGGSVHWPGADPQQQSQHFLTVGDTATEITKVLSCEPKIIKKTGENMLVVGVEKEFRDSKDNLCVLDRRNWVFREALDPSIPASPPAKPSELSTSQIEERDQGMVVREFERNEATLFRFSGITFNAHRIHYDLPWATKVEGHRSVVVHGPLNLISLLDFWRDETVNQGVGTHRDDIVYPKQIQYRATSPVYAGEKYRAVMNASDVGQPEAKLQVLSNDGAKCMDGTINDWP